MFRKHFLMKLALIVLVVVLGAGVVAYAAAGDSSDPLVSLSYIQNVLKPELMDKLGSLVGTAKTDLSGKIDDTLDEFKSSISSNAVGNNLGDSVANALKSGSSGYETVTLSEGQRVSLSVGCEFLFVSGSAACTGTVSDTTSGSAVTDGAMEANHLYLCPSDAAVAATGEAELLVKGSYSME